VSRPLERLEDGDFRAHLATPFRVLRPDGEALEIFLVEVTPHTHLPGGPARRRGFSLLFRSAVSGHLRQGTYRLDHADMGTLELFLVPVGPRDGGMCYEAVFN
jgi:Domain of unknown function (DUF6916)